MSLLMESEIAPATADGVSCPDRTGNRRAISEKLKAPTGKFRSRRSDCRCRDERHRFQR
jgi:hypothetical protein